MLRLRLLTTLFLLPFAIICILWIPATWLAIVVGLVLTLGCWEWTNLVPLKNMVSRILFVLLITIATLAAALLEAHPYVFSQFFIYLSVLFWIWGCVAVFCYATNHTSCGLKNAFAKILFGLVIFPSCFFSIMYLRAVDEVSGLPWLLLALFVVVAADVGAFFAGKLWGVKLLAERASPKKTWAGFWGGVIFAMVISLVFTGTILVLGQIDGARFVRINIASLMAVLFSIMGDLVESIMKRQVGIKDSGNILPGHGGILDRIDSILVAMPIFLLMGFSSGL